MLAAHIIHYVIDYKIMSPVFVLDGKYEPGSTVGWTISNEAFIQVWYFPSDPLSKVQPDVINVPIWKPRRFNTIFLEPPKHWINLSEVQECIIPHVAWLTLVGNFKTYRYCVQLLLEPKHTQIGVIKMDTHLALADYSGKPKCAHFLKNILRLKWRFINC